MKMGHSNCKPSDLIGWPVAVIAKNMWVGDEKANVVRGAKRMVWAPHNGFESIFPVRNHLREEVGLGSQVLGDVKRCQWGLMGGLAVLA